MDKATTLTLLFTAVFVIGGISFAVNQAPARAPARLEQEPITDKISPDVEATFLKEVRKRGYICKQPSSIRHLVDEPGLTMRCEGWTYDFHQVAGRWAITVRKGRFQ